MPVICFLRQIRVTEKPLDQSNLGRSEQHRAEQVGSLKRDM